MYINVVNKVRGGVESVYMTRISVCAVMHRKEGFYGY